MPNPAPAPMTPDALLAQLDRLGIRHVTTRHPPVFTVEEARRLRGEIEGLHCKNLFLRDKKKNLFLVVAEEDQDVDLKALKPLIGAQGTLSFGSADLLRQFLGVEPGSVTPLAAVNDPAHRVRVVVEARLASADRVSFHPLVNTMTTTMGGADLNVFLAWTGHEALVLSLS